MISFLRKVYKKIKKLVFNYNLQHLEGVNDVYDFNISNPLGGNGERVDIEFNSKIDYEKLDIYQKSHIKRYDFANSQIGLGSICGDFACGTGYGSILLSNKAGKVIGVDFNLKVIKAIKKRYKHIKNVEFLSDNLLNLQYISFFDTIVSFETIEHFSENDLIKLLKLFNKALVFNGSLFFSTPYMQEKSEGAIKLGFHLTFFINEEKIIEWLNLCGFEVESFSYQNYDTHLIEEELVLTKKDFIICKAKKVCNA